MIYTAIASQNTEVTPYFVWLRLTSPYFDFKILQQLIFLTSLFLDFYGFELQTVNPSEVSEVSEVSKMGAKSGKIKNFIKNLIK